MREIEAKRIMAQITDSDWSSYIKNLKEILSIANSLIFDRAKRVNTIETERLHISNLLAQKILLHSSTILAIAKGISYPLKNNNEVHIQDPFSLNVIFRSLVECYLTLNHINFSETEEQKEIKFKLWSQYGLRQRGKMTITVLKKEGELVQENDRETIEELVNDIKSNINYLNLDEDKKDTFLEQITKDWKFGFKKNTYLKYSWQELLDKSGLNNDLYSDLYNYLSWFAHSSSISIYQLRDIYSEFREIVEITNVFRDTAVFIAVAITDLIKIDTEFKKQFDLLNQEEKNLINMYNFIFRDESYTIDFRKE
jgi:hypothetical protein